MARTFSRPSRSLAEITARFAKQETVPGRVAASLRESILTGLLRPGDPIEALVDFRQTDREILYLSKRSA